MKRHIFAAAAAATILLTITGCGSDDTATGTEQQVIDTTTAPQQVQWENWQGVPLPVSASDGPSTIDGDVARGYSATPQGAVLAAVQGITRLRLAPDSSWPQVANTVAAPGEGRDTYAVNRAMITITGPAPTGTEASITGFRVVDYTPEQAVVELARKRADTTVVATTHTLVWAGDDWKLVLPGPDSEAPAAASLANLDGFTEFEAAR